MTGIEQKQPAIESAAAVPTKDMGSALLFSCEIPGRCPVKKNTQRVVGYGKKRRVIYSAAFSAWERIALVKMRIAQLDRPRIEKPMHLVLSFHFENRQAEADVSNLVEGPQDALKLAGVILDDKLVHKITATKHFGTEPKVIIQIFDLID